MPTKADIKRRSSKPKLKIRKGDKIVIIAGRDKGQEGYVLAVAPDKLKALVLQDNPENPDQPLPLNTAIKHRKARYQGEKSSRMRIPVPIHISNLMVLDPESGNPTRIGRRLEDGKLVRYGKDSGKTIIDPSNIEEKD
ncbi:MAG: 50S ribosomal protein L24 [Armatimonadetes bacterium]|nr:50S ribosomal protein L24 [Armatimonadota bacterium]